MFQKCKPTVRNVGLLTLLVMAIGATACETEKSRNPLSPSIAGPIEGVTISQPAVMGPASGSLVRVTDQPMALKFGPATSNSERPFWYEIEVASDESFGQILHASGAIAPGGGPVAPASATAEGQREGTAEPASGNVETYQLEASLDPEKMYYWRVRAADGANTGEYSPASTFEVFTPITLEAPEPVFPVDNQVITTRQPQFRVNSAEVGGPATDVTYRFEISNNANFANLVAVLTVSAGDGVTLATPGNLSWDDRFYWRARVSATGREGRVHGPWSSTSSFRTPKVPLGVPTPISPTGGATVSSIPPTLIAKNPSLGGSSGAVTLRFQISTNSLFSTIVASNNVPMSGGSQTSTTFGNLAGNKQYYWRVSAKNSLFTSDWSAGKQFRTPAAPATPPPPSGGGGGGGGFSPGGSPNAPFTTNGGNPPNMLHIVQQVANQYPGALRNSCQSHGGSWEFMDRVVERLRAIDGRWAYNCKRGNCGDVSHDVVDYYRGGGNPNGSSDVAIIDIIGGHCGSNPSPAWIDQTGPTQQAGSIGRWKYPR